MMHRKHSEVLGQCYIDIILVITINIIIEILASPRDQLDPRLAPCEILQCIQLLLSSP